MRMIEAAATRLDQSMRRYPRAFCPNTRSRNAIWRCILGRHGSECAEWVRAGTSGVPGFCSNREFHLERDRNAA